MNRRRFIKSLLFAGAGAGLIGTYSIFVERYLLQENHYRITLKNLPKEFAGFRIVQLTDIHHGLMVSKEAVEHVVSHANSIDRDITVCTGDYVHTKRKISEINTVWPVLKELKAPMGVYSVLGNHDHWVDTKRSLYWLEKSGQSVRHRSVPLEKNGKRIWIGGAGDMWEDELRIDEAFSGVGPDEFKILLAHNPDTADRLYKTKPDLIISGHTHGGQIRLPFIGAPVLPVYNKRYSSGLVRTERTSVFISRGIGWAVAPIRLNCPPEIAVLHLYPQ